MYKTSIIGDVMLLVMLCSCLSACVAEVFFEEDFSAGWESRWTQSSAVPNLGSVIVSPGRFFGDKDMANGLQTSEDAKFYAISASHKEFTNQGRVLVIQFSVKHEQGIDCGGGYIKLGSFDKENFNGTTGYNIMFGPDICGALKKTHVIFNYKGETLEKKAEVKCESDLLTHLYTLIVNPDDTYEIQIDMNKVDEGKLEGGWEFLEPRQIANPEDKKPEDWVDAEMVNDPEDMKPVGYDDILPQIPDPTAIKPGDWDDENDGVWEAPLIENQEFKGEWSPKRIRNPEFTGAWKPSLIPNPQYTHQDMLHSYPKFSTIGIDIWQVKSGTIFDNILLTDDISYATKQGEQLWKSQKHREMIAHDEYVKSKAPVVENTETVVEK